MKTIAAAVLGGHSACWPAAASAPAKPVELRISLWVPPAHPLVPSTKDWAADIDKASGGTIKSVVFPSEQLGKAFDHYDMARDGIADLTYVNPGYQPGRFPIIAAGQLPFMFGDAHKGSQALDAWYRKYAAIEMKDTHFCLAFIHDPGTFHARKKILLPTDIKGMKVRPAQSTIGELVTSLGGTNVQASAPESRDMLERGVADAITFPWNSIFLFGIDKVVKFHMDVPLYTTAFVYAMNQVSLRRHVGGAEKSDRRSLHHRMGGATDRTLVRFRIRRAGENARGAGARSVRTDARATGGLENGVGAVAAKLGRRCEENRTRSRCHHGRPEGHHRQIRRRALTGRYHGIRSLGCSYGAMDSRLRGNDEIVAP